MLLNLQPKHFLLAFGVGVVAGVLIVVLDSAVVQKAEAALGVTPSAA